MITGCQLNLLRELHKGPKTRKQQNSFLSLNSLRDAEELFLDNDLARIDENDNREKVMTVTDKGERILAFCEQLVKEGVNFV